MSNAIFKFTRQIAVVLSLGVSVFYFAQGETVRALMNIVLLGAFLYTSVLYQAKNEAVTVSYWFIFINVYLVFSVVSCFYTHDRIYELDQTGFQGWNTTDQYPIYFWGVLLSYTVMILFLKATRKKELTNMSQIVIFPYERFNIYIGMLFVTGIYLVMGRNELLIIPVLAMLLLLIYWDKKNRVFNLFLLLVYFLLVKDVFLTRYQLIQVVFPVFVAILVKSDFKKRKVSMRRLYAVVITLVAAVGIYGIVSEVYKLNLLSGGNTYSIKEILSSGNSFIYFFSRQAYRLFIGWIKLGGYIIYHTQISGYAYGLTYIKSLAGIFGFEYISLPEIAARYNGSTYAQPGLLAEGYANFGIFGIVLNICLMFFVMEFIKSRYSRKGTFTSLMYMVIPFTKVLFDGGTLNSVIAVLVVVFMIEGLNEIHIRFRQ